MKSLKTCKFLHIVSEINIKVLQNGLWTQSCNYCIMHMDVQTKLFLRLTSLFSDLKAGVKVSTCIRTSWNDFLVKCKGKTSVDWLVLPTVCLVVLRFNTEAEM